MPLVAVAVHPAASGLACSSLWPKAFLSIQEGDIHVKQANAVGPNACGGHLLGTSLHAQKF